ncbi:hypothetical protein niasHT_010376 [Heterodera trifolii]|uniref:Alkylglycerol monooxygenase C-terminal domain-containing protein n=1 Tax=Heterodera trifolii TaxID=157864 RepID=A0ABD2MBF2_9BILA
MFYNCTQIELPVQRYDPPISPCLKAYCLGHLLIILCMFMHFEQDRSKLGYLNFTMKLAFFICSMQAFGAFFDKKPYAPYLETIRCLGLIAYYATPTIKDIFRPSRIFITVPFIASAIGWAVFVLLKTVVCLRSLKFKFCRVEFLCSGYAFVVAFGWCCCAEYAFQLLVNWTDFWTCVNFRADHTNVPLVTLVSLFVCDDDHLISSRRSRTEVPVVPSNDELSRDQIEPMLMPINR